MRFVLHKAIILGIVVACQPNSSVTPSGSASAVLNGKAWTTDRVDCRVNTVCYKGRLGVGLTKYRPDGTKQETIFFHKVPKKIGLYFIAPADNDNFCVDTLVRSNFTTNTADGDVLQDSYELSSSTRVNNSLEVTAINQKTGEITGKFNVVYVISIRSSKTAPDTIRVNNGQFQAWIRDM